MKKAIILATVFIGLAVAGCSETGYYRYSAPYTYDPSDPDYTTILNVPENRQYFDVYEWRYTDHAPANYGNDSVIVFPVND